MKSKDFWLGVLATIVGGVVVALILWFLIGFSNILTDLQRRQIAEELNNDDAFQELVMDAIQDKHQETSNWTVIWPSQEKCRRKNWH